MLRKFLVRILICHGTMWWYMIAFMCTRLVCQLSRFSQYAILTNLEVGFYSLPLWVSFIFTQRLDKTDQGGWSLIVEGPSTWGVVMWRHYHFHCRFQRFNLFIFMFKKWLNYRLMTPTSKLAPPSWEILDPPLNRRVITKVSQWIEFVYCIFSLLQNQK